MKTLQQFKRFSPKHIYAILVLSATLLMFFTVITSSRDVSDIPEQSKAIKFSHKFHTQEAGVACADCHGEASASTLASDNLMAKKAACQTCHEEQLQQNCSFCHTSVDTTAYVPVANPERELVFSHQTHVEGQKIACETCHQDLDNEGVATGGNVPAMATCNTCHNDVKATNSCETCHTDLAALRPRDHNRTDFIRLHKQSARVASATCASCHTQESCIDCHNGVDLVKVDVPGRDLMSPHSPRLTGIDRGQTQAVVKVHDLNFRFTHGIAAKGKAVDCQTCHSQQEFCATCHEAGGNVNQLKFKPSSHQEAGFVTIGVGSGGGVHAKLAKRDIESCASCHNPEAADPTCVTCHTDADGIKGTDPRTHERGFMAGVNGPWHSDPGANCFTCHSDANAQVGGIKGQGFCGYCHK